MIKIFKKSSIELEIPKNPKYLICCDVDETYLPYKHSLIRNSGIKKFENFFLKKYKNKGYILCWITGSSIRKFKQKLKYVNIKPHIIASDLGSEILINKNNNLVKDPDWHKNFNKKIFFKNYHEVFTKIKKKYSIKKESFGELRRSFYVYGLDKSIKVKNFLKFIRRIVANKKIEYNLSKSSSMAGDPRNTYDLDITPFGSGKKKSMFFIKKKYSINKKNVIAFGDSFNDFDLMNSCKYRFLVGNASPEVKKSKKLKNKIILKKKYCKGIIEGMKIFEKSLKKKL